MAEADRYDLLSQAVGRMFVATSKLEKWKTLAKPQYSLQVEEDSSQPQAALPNAGAEAVYMLRKIVSIRNVGRFEKYGASGDVELKRFNLVFAENGRGKTTLCALLRSLQSGDRSYVVGRATLGKTDPPEVEILTGDGIAAFRHGAWTTIFPDITIFDSTFVSEYVHSGDVVSLGHKRSLYSVIVGKQGVDLAHQIDVLDGKSRAKAAEISEKAAGVQALAPRGMTVETFIALEEDAGIQDKINPRKENLMPSNRRPR